MSFREDVKIGASLKLFRWGIVGKLEMNRMINLYLSLKRMLFVALITVSLISSMECFYRIDILSLFEIF